MDLIKREDAERYFGEFLLLNRFSDFKKTNIEKLVGKLCERIPSAEPTIEIDADQLAKLLREGWTIHSEPKQGEWIPIKWHEITDKEREEEGYPEEWSVFIDSVMPNDGERILVTTKRGEVEIDTCCEDDGFYLDSGWDWVDDIVAWMPLPEPWEGAEDA